jgi:hypothetical protein
VVEDERRVAHNIGKRWSKSPSPSTWRTTARAACRQLKLL